MPSSMRRLLPLALIFGACSSDARTVTLDVTLGHEAEAFGLTPRVTRVLVQALDAKETVVASTESAPGGTFSLGEFPLTDLVRLEADGRDENGVTRMRGRTMGLVLGDLASDVLPLFMQRVDAFARPPSGLLEGHDGGATAVVGERFLLLTGGDGADAARATFYDLLSLGPAEGGALPRLARTLVPSSQGSAMLVIGPSAEEPGGPIGASWVDFDDGTVTEVKPPDGLASFDELAGARTVTAEDGTAYVVGGSRSDGPSDAVLVVAPERTLRVARLSAPRLGAAVAWLAETGVVVAGGSATAPGVETLAAGTALASPRPFPADATVGATLVPTGSADEVLFLGGVLDGMAAPTRVAMARCATTCTTTTLALDGLGAALVACHGYAVSPGQTLAVCRDATTNESRAFRVATAPYDVVPLPLREPRRGATPLPTPTGGLALLGGTRLEDAKPALTVELWSPP